jgi:hypothetical protein
MFIIPTHAYSLHSLQVQANAAVVSLAFRLAKKTSLCTWPSNFRSNQTVGSIAQIFGVDPLTLMAVYRSRQF